MPYRSVRDLPESVRKNLPKHAQEIYRKAFNNADKQYKEEKTAHMVAWAAVKKEYVKKGGRWVRKKASK